MKKFITLVLGTCLCAACAEFPPAWWTPGGTKPSSTGIKTPVPASKQETTEIQTNPAPTMVELELSLPDEEYEEMTLTPLQDEEEENDSGETSAQSVPPEDEDTLPPPSILEE